MNTITKRTIALTLAAAAISVSITPSMARTTRAQQVEPNGYGAYAAQYPNQRNSLAPVSGDGYSVPGTVLAAPNQCWTDDGYGRWSSCENSGN